jgi:hypothetical protein
MPTQRSTATKIPKAGWVHELGDAESAAKRSPSAGAQLRLAIAAFKLRDFKKLKTAANLGLVLDPSEDEKELLKEYIEKSKEQKEMILPRNLIQEMYEPGADCDTFLFASDITPFTNLTILHYAVSTGDVTLMEEVVARGAALDFPVSDINTSGIPPLPAPPGSTALLLACALLAMYGEMERRYPNFRNQNVDTIDRICECATRLVHLGANCQVKLQIPAQRRNTPVNPKDPVTAYRAYNLDGKTAQQLASMSRRRELIRAIELMQKTENVHLTQCRCGSRLPWNQCHGAPVPGQSDFYILCDDGRLDWRYSPKARCPCNLTNKEHYNCCWFTSTPIYKNDTSRERVQVCRTVKNINIPTTPESLQIEQKMISKGIDIHAPIDLQDMTSKELQTRLTDYIRSGGLLMQDDVNGRRSGVKDWDPMVYAGVVDRFVTDYFIWTDLHWRLDKVELLRRTKEWNKTLKKYCDDVELTGAEREAVVQKHTANPCAPCSNPSCNNWETEPKEFKRCSRCKSVAYCSSDCQKKNWKAQHKSTWCVAT